MKSTYIIKNELHELLAKEAVRQYGSAKKMSELLNQILLEYFGKKHDLFGSTKRLNLANIREKKDRF